MMQQVATQRSQIAALPESKSGSESQSGSDFLLSVGDTTEIQPSGKGQSFSAVFQQEQNGNQQVAPDRQLHGKGKSAPQDTTAEGSTTGNEPTVSAKPAKTDDRIDVIAKEQVDKVVAEPDEESLIVQDESELPIASVLADLAPPQVDETDYLALVDAIRAFEEKVAKGKEQSQLLSDDLTTDPVAMPGKIEDIDGELTILPTEVGGALGEQQLLTDLRAWLDEMIVGESPEAVEATPLQQMHAAESILSDMLALANKVKEFSVEEASASTEDLAAATLLDTDIAVDAEATEEPTALALAAELLKGLPGNQDGQYSTGESSEGEISELNITLNTLDSDPDAEDISLALDSAENTEPAIDEEMLNQAKLLVGLMVLAQKSQDANTSADSSVSDSTTTTNTTDPMTAMLAQASDKVLEQLAQVMTDSVSQVNPDLTETQLSQLRGQLVTGMEEIRSQLKQGHEPAIDLTALVNQVVKEVAPDSNNGTVVSVMQDIEQVSQLASAATMNPRQEQELTELLTATRDVIVQEARHQHSDTMKSLQQQAALDKPVPIHQPQGQQQMAEKIRWMVNARQSMAEIRLDPPELGSMQVRLNITGDTASVNFIVQSQHAKDVLADAMPRLREMFADQGIDLGESFVNQQGSEQASDEQFADSNTGGFADEEFEDNQVHETRVVRPANGLIDDYV